jgi:hypothetical protein
MEASCDAGAGAFAVVGFAVRGFLMRWLLTGPSPTALICSTVARVVERVLPARHLSESMGKCKRFQKTIKGESQNRIAVELTLAYTAHMTRHNKENVYLNEVKNVWLDQSSGRFDVG